MPSGIGERAGAIVGNRSRWDWQPQDERKPPTERLIDDRPLALRTVDLRDAFEIAVASS
jgi:hypothetical protein